MYDYTRFLNRNYLPKFKKKKLPEITYDAIPSVTDTLAATPREHAQALAVGRRRVISKCGFISRHTVEMNMTRS